MDLAERLAAFHSRQRVAEAGAADAMIHFIGEGTVILSGTYTPGEKRVLPSVKIMLGKGRFFQSILGTATFLSYHLVSGEVRLELGYAEEGYRLLEVLGDLTIEGGSMRPSIAEPLNTTVDENESPNISVHGNYMQTGGTFSAEGGKVLVMGDFWQGAMLDAEGADPGANATFDLNSGVHYVMGDFHVGEDAEKDKRNRYLMKVDGDEEEGAFGLWVHGDYHFAGTGDMYGEDYEMMEQGLMGPVTFMGMDMQHVSHAETAAAMFGNVVVSSTATDGIGGIMLMSDVRQNTGGTLTLKRGQVDGMYTWAQYNGEMETGLKGRYTAPEDAEMGAVRLGSRDSYMKIDFSRIVTEGTGSGGVVTDAYVFPVGMEGAEGAERDVDYFRPLLLQFASDLGKNEYGDREISRRHHGGVS